MKYIFTFKNSHVAIKCKKNMILSFPELQLVPTPRSISSECGFTILIETTNISEFMNQMKHRKLKFIEVFMQEDNKYIKIEGENENY